MTAPKATITITSERVQWFADYYRINPNWGIFHVCLGDGNYKLGASDHIWDSHPYFEGTLREMAAWFNRLSPSQRKRLGQKAENLASSVTPTEKQVEPKQGPATSQ